MVMGMPSKKELEELAAKMKEEKEMEHEGTGIVVKFKHLNYDVEIHGEILKNIKERIEEVKMDLK